MEAEGAYGFIFKEESSPVTCATYGRTSEINSETEEACQVTTFEEGSATCVIAFDIETASSLTTVENQAELLTNIY